MNTLFNLLLKFLFICWCLRGIVKKKTKHTYIAQVHGRNNGGSNEP